MTWSVSPEVLAQVCLKAPNREQEYLSFVAQTNQIKSDIRNFKTEWLRNKALYDEKMISEEEYNKYYYQYLDKTNEP